MKLKDFLKYFSDEEARIELEIDKRDKSDYIYESFWFSDYYIGSDESTKYNDYKVIGFSFMTEFSDSDIQIRIKE